MYSPIPSLLKENLATGVPTHPALSWGRALWQMPALWFGPHAFSYRGFAPSLPGDSALRDRWVLEARLHLWNKVAEGVHPPATSNYQETRDYLPETSQLGARPPGKQLEKLRHWVCSLTPLREKVGDARYCRSVIGPDSESL